MIPTKILLNCNIDTDGIETVTLNLIDSATDQSYIVDLDNNPTTAKLAVTGVDADADLKISSLSLLTALSTPLL